MTQNLYAHMNNKTKKNQKKKTLPVPLMMDTADFLSK
jgi:hypothetical protein